MPLAPRGGGAAQDYENAPVAGVVGMRGVFRTRGFGGIVVANSDGYYAPNGVDSVRFRLIRQKSGDLFSLLKVGEIQDCGTMETRFPSDGSPIEAAQVFGRHWEPFLQGLTLVPIDQK